MKTVCCTLVGFLIISGVYLKTCQGQSKSNSKEGWRPPPANGSIAASESSNGFSIGSDTHQDEAKAKSYYKMGVKYGRAGLFKQAEISFLQAIRLKSNYADAYYGLGHAYLDLGRWQDAIEALEQVIKIDPEDDDAYAKLGEAYTQLKAQTKTFFRENDAPAITKAGLNISQAPRSTSSNHQRQPTVEKIIVNVPRASGFSISVPKVNPTNDRGALNVPPAVSNNSRSQKVAFKVSSAPASDTSNKARVEASPAPASIRERFALKASRAPRSNDSTNNKAPGTTAPAATSTSEKVALKVSPAPTTSDNSMSSKAPKKSSPVPASISQNLKLSSPTSTANVSLLNNAKAQSSPASAMKKAELNVSPILPPSTNPTHEKNEPSVSLVQASADSTGNRVALSASSPSTSYNSTTERAPLSVSPAPEPNNSTTDKVELKVSPPSDSANSTDEKSPRKISSPPASNDSVGTNEPNDVDLTRIYRVGVGDILDIRLSDAPSDQSSLFTVSPAGLLEYPIIARPLKVVGLTADQISERVASEMKNLAINENLAVSVGVRDYVSHTLLVSGLVKDAGTKVLRREAIPLYVAIADAQPMPEAGRAMIIARATGQAQFVDLSDLRAMNLLVRPGDVITVQQNPKQFFYISGEVKTPGEKSFRPGLKLTQSIILAGGLTRKSEEARVAREGTNGLLFVTHYNLQDINSGKVADPLIQADDRITVVH